jgi:transglutaminase-like putative cysteine protease
MWLQVEHVTTFSYDEAVSDAYTELRLTPVEAGGQRRSAFHVEVSPARTRVLSYVDHFGNEVRHFDVLEPHDRLVVTTTSGVYTPVRLDDPGPLSLLEQHDYLQPTDYAPLLDAATVDAPPASGTSPYERALELSTAVMGALVYETGATDVHTTALEALELGRGVCQDFAHVLIGLCRREKIPARYVSGYLFDTAAPAGRQAASHAWMDVFTERGWVSLDPTHGREQDEHYVRVGVGRDYADVPPTKGVYRGNAKEELAVTVRVTAS